ncbi:MAG: hypothetical protein ACE14M_03885 [Terriglobales bacterium]
MPFAAIYVPDFPVQALVRLDPELRQQPVAVVEGSAPLLKVVAMDERARAAGVEIGMTPIEAMAKLTSLAKTRSSGGFHGDLEIRQRAPAQEEAAHAALLDCACACSPRVEDTAPDTVLLDLSGLERLFGTPDKIARDLKRCALEMGLEANIAVAANPESALHAARGFAGVTVIAPGKEAECLGRLPVEVLAPSAEILEILDRWGVRTFSALAALPEVAVAERLGPAGVGLQKLARGEGERPLVPAEPPLELQEAVELDFPVELLEPLAFLLNPMLEQLCARLSARGLSTSELRLRMRYEHPPQRHRDTEKTKANRGSPRMRADQSEIENQESKPKFGNQKSEIGNTCVSSYLRGEYELTLRLPVPMLDAKVFLKLLQLELKAKPPEAAVFKVFLEAEPAQPRFTQGGLFLPSAPEPEKLEVTLARIKAVVNKAVGSGEWSVASENTGAKVRSHDDPITRSPDDFVGSPELVDTHRPDAFRMRPFVPPAADTQKRDERPARAAAQKPVAALRRLRPPVRTSVQLENGKPIRISMPEMRASRVTGVGCATRIENRKSGIGNVIWAAGPWRNSGGWWLHSTDAWNREEWDIAVADQDTVTLYRIYRDVATDEWFVEASYD